MMIRCKFLGKSTSSFRRMPLLNGLKVQFQKWVSCASRDATHLPINPFGESLCNVLLGHLAISRFRGISELQKCIKEVQASLTWCSPQPWEKSSFFITSQSEEKGKSERLAEAGNGGEGKSFPIDRESFFLNGGSSVKTTKANLCHHLATQDTLHLSQERPRPKAVLKAEEGFSWPKQTLINRYRKKSWDTVCIVQQHLRNSNASSKIYLHAFFCSTVQ